MNQWQYGMKIQREPAVWRCEHKALSNSRYFIQKCSLLLSITNMLNHGRAKDRIKLPIIKWQPLCRCLYEGDFRKMRSESRDVFNASGGEIVRIWKTLLKVI